MKEIVELTKDLIRFKSTQSRPEEIDKCVVHIENFLKQHQISYERLEQGNTPSILVMPENGYVSLLLMSHIDVVDGPDSVFEPCIENGKLFGRGSIDDKYGAALSLVMLKNQILELKKEGRRQHDLKLGVLITGDEEIGGHTGAEPALSKINPDFCIALDGGRVDKIVVKEKGLFTLKLTTKGQAVHGSRPWLGENAILNLIDDFDKLKPFFEKESSDHWHKTISFNIIRAGNAFNQVPDTAEAVFDIRFTEDDDLDALYMSMKNAVGGDLQIIRKEPMFFSGQSPYLKMLLEASPNSRFGFAHGASDARFLPDRGIPGVVWGADGDNSAHSTDEHINIPSIRDLYERISAFLTLIKKNIMQDSGFNSNGRVPGD
jgi:succinyl-diaminopimelate desuccinylase